MPLSELRMRLQLRHPAARAEARHAAVANSAAQATTSVNPIKSRADSPSAMDSDYDPAGSPPRPTQRREKAITAQAVAGGSVKAETPLVKTENDTAVGNHVAPIDEDDDVGLEPIYELYEALLMVVLRVCFCSQPLPCHTPQQSSCIYTFICTIVLSLVSHLVRWPFRCLEERRSKYCAWSV